MDSHGVGTAVLFDAVIHILTRFFSTP